MVSGQFRGYGHKLRGEAVNAIAPQSGFALPPKEDARLLLSSARRIFSSSTPVKGALHAQLFVHARKFAVKNATPDMPKWRIGYG
jgi:hypothetical protein